MSETFKVRVNQLPVIEVPADGSQSLLEALEAAGIETRYHCRTGFCGACRSKLHEGEVEYVNDPLAYIRPGEVLPCICIAKSDLILDH
ncbi:MAG: 2Fe-2S ferredoxin-like protein [Idiomarina sp.]|nr:2Fe-2S ferredoxin-like protein [Idiomarina sp.]